MVMADCHSESTSAADKIAKNANNVQSWGKLIKDYQ